MNISYNLAGLQSIDANDDSFLKEMIHLFIDSTSTGMIEIQHALDQENWHLVAETAHKVLGPCKHLEVMPLSQTLKTIEHTIFEQNNTTTVPELVNKAKSEANETILAFQKLIAK